MVSEFNMKIKIKLMFYLLLFYSSAYSQTGRGIEKDNIPVDSTIGNFKLCYGYVNIYSHSGVKQTVYQLNLCHGGRIGFTLKLSDYVDFQSAYHLFFSTTNSSVMTAILDFGLQFNTVKGKTIPYLGFGFSGCSTNEDGLRVGGNDYNSMTFPVGVTYELNDKLFLDLNARFSLKFNFDKMEVYSDRIIFGFGLIHDI